MNSNDTAIAAAETIKRLQIENRKLLRQLELANLNLEKARLGAQTLENFSFAISREKEMRERLMNLLLEHSPDIIIYLDREGKFVFATESFLRNIKINNFGLINGKYYREVFRYFVSERDMESLDSMIRSGVASFFEAKYDLGGTGAFRNYSITASPVQGDAEGMDGALVIFHDMTEIIASRERAEAANVAKSEFLATMSHEIRTPLNAITGLVRILSDTPLNDMQRVHLENVTNSSRMLLSLINDILDFSKIEAGKLTVLNENFRFVGLLERLQAMFSVMFAQKGIEFVCSFAGDIPKVIFTDDGRLGQIITNVLNNALKYTQTGTVWFSVFMRREKTCIEIKDTGMGIHERDIEKLFQPFEQFDAVKNKRIVGSGLGLAITDSLCRLLGGSISVESEYGKGSTFMLEFEFVEGTERNVIGEDYEKIEFVAPMAKVMVVDDIEINLVVAAAMLESFKIKPTCVLSGKEAIAIARTNEYDLIFMDHMMPEMDGIEATKELRALGGKTGTVPIIALTANVVQGAREMFMKAGMSDILSKPIDDDEMNACLAKWLPRGRIIRI